MPKRSTVLPADLATARRRIEKWRAGGRPRRKLPQDMWSMAAELVPTHGVYRVARVLRLEYYKVKQAAQTRGGKKGRRAKSTFVQLAPSSPASPLPFAGCTVELTDGNGRQMTIRTPASFDAASLVAAFWDGSTCSK